MLEGSGESVSYGRVSELIGLNVVCVLQNLRSIFFCLICCEFGCVLVKVVVYSGYVLDKFYFIFCIFKFKFFINKKNDIIMQMNKILILEV